MRAREMVARRWGATVLVALAVGGISACAGTSRGTRAEYTAVELQTGKSVSLGEYRGKVVLASTWATWCAPCKKEMPKLQRLFAERGGDDFVVVAVNVNAKGPEERSIDGLVEDWNLTMPVWRDAADRFTAQFKGIGVPMSVLISADGSVLRTWHGAIDPHGSEFRKALDAALSKS